MTWRVNSKTNSSPTSSSNSFASVWSCGHSFTLIIGRTITIYRTFSFFAQPVNVSRFGPVHKTFHSNEQTDQMFIILYSKMSNIFWFTFMLFYLFYLSSIFMIFISSVFWYALSCPTPFKQKHIHTRMRPHRHAHAYTVRVSDVNHSYSV